MKYKTVVERIGENLGPIDYAYDFAKHDWGGGRGGVNPEVTQAAIAHLRKLETLFADKSKRVEVRLMHSDCYWLVLAVGMYDGWPFWAPTPSVQVYRVLGSEWRPWYYVQDVRVVEEPRAQNAEAGALPKATSVGAQESSSTTATE